MVMYVYYAKCSHQYQIFNQTKLECQICQLLSPGIILMMYATLKHACH